MPKSRIPKPKNRRTNKPAYQVLKVYAARRHRSGCFEIRSELIEYGDGSTLEWATAYSPHGHYIGPAPVGRNLAKYGIVPELPTPKHRVCAVGYSPKEKAWYGWSHRAIVGFKVGDMIFEEKFPGATDKTPFRKHGRRKIETLAQAREAAVAFAAYVS